MAVTGIVLRPNNKDFDIINRYYASAPHEPTKRGLLPIDRVDAFRCDFLHLVEMIHAKRRSHVVLVTHGTPRDGIAAPIAPEAPALCHSCLTDLAATLDRLESTQCADFARESELFAQMWGLKLDSAQRMLRSCYAIRNTEEICAALHIRGCNIGKNYDHLWALRNVLNATVVTAPACPMFYASIVPYVGIDTFLKTHQRPTGRRYIYQAPGRGRLLLDSVYLGDRANAEGAVDKHSDVAAWAKVFQQRPTTASTNSFAVAAMWPDYEDRCWYAHERDYTEYLAFVRVP